MRHEIGGAHFFCTFSAADLHWERAQKLEKSPTVPDFEGREDFSQIYRRAVPREQSSRASTPRVSPSGAKRAI